MKIVHHRTSRLLALVFGVALLAAACGGGNDDTAAAECGTASTSPDASGVLLLEGTDDGKGGDNCFDFTVLELTAGEEVTVEFENTGLLQHTFTVNDWDVDTGLVDSGDTATVTFTVPEDASGDVTFHCIPHEALGMTGTIQVT